MTLYDAIAEVLDLTGAIEDALAHDNHLAALEMIPQRGLAMERFREAHRSAGPEELSACCRQLVELKRRDEKLQREAGSRLQETAEILHGHAASRGHRPENQACLSGCLDRRA